MSFEKTKSRALLIGVGKREADSPAMAISAEDAVYLRKALKVFDLFPEERIQTLTNEEATRANILTTLQKIGNESTTEAFDLVLVFFSGHGSKRGDNYHVVCRDTTAEDLDGTGIAGHDFVTALNTIRANKMLVLLDCCHAEGIGIDVEREVIPFNSESFLNQSNRVILTACSQAQVSYLSSPLSVFTYAVIEALGGKLLRTEDREVNIFNLAMDVRERVIALSRQVLSNTPQQPQLNILKGGNTTNFSLARYAKGGTQEITLLREKPLQSFDGTKTFQLDVPSVRDEDHRNTYNWFTVQNFFQNVGQVNQVFVQTLNNNIVVTAGNEILELKNDFKNFQELIIQHLKKITIKAGSGGKEYDLREMTEYEFELYTGKREINQELTITLMKRFAATDETASRYLAGPQTGDAKKYVVKKYGGVLRVQLRKLMSVGQLELHEFDIKEYILRCIATGRRALQVLTYSMMAKLWGLKKTGNNVQINSGELELIGVFFSVKRSRGLDWELTLVHTLYSIFERNKFELPIPEISSLAPLLEDGKLMSYCQDLQAMERQLALGQFKLDDCVRAEKLLCPIMEATDFLVHYKMISVKDIFYEKLPFDPPKFFHNHTEVGRDSTDNFAETFINSSDPVWTDAVLLFRTEFTNGINLFPFAIDMNSLTRDASGAKIYLYSKDDPLNNLATYNFTDDDSSQDIIDQAEPRQEDFIGAMRWEAIKKQKLNRIYTKLQEAKRTILN